MLNKTLKADCIEIAPRVIRTCREMGMRRLALILGVVMSTGCGQDATDSTIDQVENGQDTTATSGHDQGPWTPYFDFDEIHHYFAQIDENELFSLFPENEEDLPENIRLTLDILTGSEPQELPERLPTFIDKLEDLGFTMKIVDAMNIPDLNDIFREKPEDPNAVFTTCIAVYRDILMFKRDGKVIGIAKICFDCLKFHFVGTDANTKNFGQHGDYGRLAKILH